MRHLGWTSKRVGTWLGLLLGWLLSASLAAQEFALPQKLTPDEAAKIKAQLSQPLPTGLVGPAIDQWFRYQDASAFRLGDPAERERILRAWYSASPNLDSKWTLGSYLMEMSNNAAEGFALLEDLLKDTKIPNQAVRLRSRLATGYIEEHKLKRAQQLLEEARQIITKDFPPVKNGGPGYWFVRAEMEFHRTHARLLMRQGLFDAALDAAKQARAKGFELKNFESFTDARQAQYGRSYHAYAATEVAVVLIHSGRLFEAEDALRESYAIFRSYQFTDDKMVGFYRFVSDLYFSQARYADSLKLAKMVQDIQRRAGVSDATAQSIWTRMRINKNLVAQAKWSEAMQEFNDMDLAVGDNDRVKPIARMVDLRGLTLLNNGRTASAIDMFNVTLKWSSDNFGLDHYFTAFKRGMYAMALSKDESRQADALREFERAIRGLTAPDALSNQFEETPFRVSLRQDIYKAYIRLLAQTQAQSPDAAAAQAFAISNHLMNATVQQAIADAAARAAIKQPGLGEVARLDQDAKAELNTLYGYIVAQAGESQQQKMTPEVVKAMRERVAVLEEQRRQYKARIQKEYPDYFQLLLPKAPTPSEIARLLGPREVFLSVVPVDQETYVFAVAPDGQVRFHRSALGQAQVAQLVKTIRTTLDVADLGARAPTFRYAESYRLYEQLLAPVASLFQDKDHLIIASGGALGQLPFAVLTTQPWNNKDPSQAPWLIRDFAISHIASPNAWVALKRLGQTPSSNKPLIAWGDPSFALTDTAAGRSAQAVRSVFNTRSLRSFDLDQPKIDQAKYATLPPLPETRDEVLSLAKVLNANPKSDVILGKDATRESVLKFNESGVLHDRQVIVFATHGLLPGDLPRLEQPALAMAASSDPNGSPLLTLEDVMGLRLNADWVVLSACNTAGADGKVEEALSGLARGFFYAGSRSLLVTHWSVESESAMMLTTRTFEAYKKNSKMRRADALRQAMLETMRTPAYAHPAFWAPYALVGEGGR